MKLGNAGQLSLGSTVFDETLEFMDILGYKKKETGQSVDKKRFCLFEDGRQLVLLSDDDNNYSRLLYFSEDLVAIRVHLDDLGISYSAIPNRDNPSMLQFQGRDNLIVDIAKQKHPGSPDPLQSKSKVPFGSFGEYAIKTENLDGSVEYWTQLGFNVTYRNDEWQFAILTDRVFVIGLHGHDMDPNAITYFDPDMPAVVDGLKAKGLKFRTEKTYRSGEKDALDASIVSPCGQVFYLFTGSV